MLEEAGVAAIPGAAFGCSGREFVRFSFASSNATLHEAVERILEAFDCLARRAGSQVGGRPAKWLAKPLIQDFLASDYLNGQKLFSVRQRFREHPKMKLSLASYLAVAISLLATSALAQSRPLATSEQVQEVYSRLLPQIEKIPIFDHHAHPGFPDDPDVDAMASPPGSAPLRERDSNPELVAAAKALFNYPFEDLSAEHAKWLVNKKAELKSSRALLTSRISWTSSTSSRASPTAP